MKALPAYARRGVSKNVSKSTSQNPRHFMAKWDTCHQNNYQISTRIIPKFTATRFCDRCKKWELLARQHACTPVLARLFILCYSVSMGKAEQVDFLEGSLFSSGGASKPHRSKYILVGPVILPLCAVCVLSFLFTARIGFRVCFSSFFPWDGVSLLFLRYSWASWGRDLFSAALAFLAAYV